MTVYTIIICNDKVDVILVGTSKDCANDMTGTQTHKYVSSETKKTTASVLDGRNP